MTISTILDNTETPVAEKLLQLAKIVSKAREAYGNTEETLTSPRVNSTEGFVDMKYLSNDDKLVIAKQQIRHITMEVIATTDMVEGAVFDKEFERLLSLNPHLSHITSKTDSKYL